MLWNITCQGILSFAASWRVIIFFLFTLAVISFINVVIKTALMKQKKGLEMFWLSSVLNVGTNRYGCVFKKLLLDNSLLSYCWAIMVKSSPATAELARILVPRIHFLWFFKKVYTYVCCTLEVKPLKKFGTSINYFLLTINLSWPYLGGGGFGAQCRFYGENALSIVYSFNMVE